MTRTTASVLALLLSIGDTVAQQRFLNTLSCTKYAAIGLVDGELPAGLTLDIGSAKRSPAPLMVQDKLWEARCDNGYPNMMHNADDPNGAYRLCTYAARAAGWLAPGSDTPRQSPLY